MATLVTLDALKTALKQAAKTTTSPPTRTLSEAEYNGGFDILMRREGRTNYKAFIIPKLSELLSSLVKSFEELSVLEIGPGPKSVLENLPRSLRSKIAKYTAFEPNITFASALEQRLCQTLALLSPLPNLKEPPSIYKEPFVLQRDVFKSTHGENEKFNIILFCHSMYGMKPKRDFIHRAVGMLVEQPEAGRVIVFHRQKHLHLHGLICHRSALFQTGVVSIEDKDEVLDALTPFIAGFVMSDMDEHKSTLKAWRELCRAKACKVSPNNLLFGAPEMMIAFPRHAGGLPSLTASVPLLSEQRVIKNPEARLYNDTNIFRPTEVEQIQQCVQWAVQHQVGLTVLGGGHSGHCIWPNVISIDMSAFDQVHIVPEQKQGSEPGPSAFVVAGGGSKTGEIIRTTMAAGLTVPLGSRPSVGAGLWLQGGIGHLGRLHGLASDAVVGAVLVSVDSGCIFCVGHVPDICRPTGSMSSENCDGLLWAIKGAGTNFGIVVSVVFRAYSAPTYSLQSWVLPLEDVSQAQAKIKEFDEKIAKVLERQRSADAYLYWTNGQLHLGVTVHEILMTQLNSAAQVDFDSILGCRGDSKIVDGVALFDSELYMSEMHGGHGGGKTSAFKRCVFLKNIGGPEIAKVLVEAFQSRPSSLCYIHLLHGGGAIGDVAHDATAFGCRNWEFACVITGVWPRDRDGTDSARAAVYWVYRTAYILFPLSEGAYAADLGPDPRDATLASRAFGENGPRLAQLKARFDPHNVLAYACPLPKVSAERSQPKLIILVTGESCAGKDYCAEIWAAVFSAHGDEDFTARVVSISDSVKREYAAASGANLDRLLRDRSYKEQHRAALTAYFHDQVQKRPKLPEEHFLDVVSSATNIDVLLVTGMRDEAPVASLSHLVAGSRLLEVQVRASDATRRARGAGLGQDELGEQSDPKVNDIDNTSSMPNVDWKPDLIFDTDRPGTQSATAFAEESLLPFQGENLLQLASVVRTISDFPRPGIDFRHVLDIVQQRGGLTLCTSLLESFFADDWSKIDVLTCCEAGGYVFAAALALKTEKPLVLIREAGKLAPPTISVKRNPSHVSNSGSRELMKGRIEMNQNVIAGNAVVTVVDDTLATGETLCAVLELLKEAGVDAKNVSVMVVAEFPIHRGRNLLRQRGFGMVRIQSLLVFGGT